jgi:hypothetical protein
LLLQYDLSDIVYILDFISIIYQVIGAIGLIIVGTSRVRKNGTINNSGVFSIGGLIVAIYFVVNGRIFSLLGGLGGLEFYEDLAPTFYALLFQMIPNLVSLTIFGVLFLFLGVKNKQNYGRFLMFSGIFWIVFGIISILQHSMILLTHMHIYIFPYEVYVSIIHVWTIGSVLTVISSVFFLIYAIKIKVKILLASSIMLLIASTFSTLGLILDLISTMYL